jgi:hypothetical protein
MDRVLTSLDSEDNLQIDLGKCVCHGGDARVFVARFVVMEGVRVTVKRRVIGSDSEHGFEATLRPDPNLTRQIFRLA